MTRAFKISAETRPEAWYEGNAFGITASAFLAFLLAGIAFGAERHQTLAGWMFVGAWLCGTLAVSFAIRNAHLSRRQRIFFRTAASVVIGLALFAGNAWLLAKVPRAPALRVTGYTLYQQTVGEPLRIGVHVTNDGASTIATAGAYSVGVFDSDDKPSLALEEKVFQKAQQEFDERATAGTLVVMEVPPQGKMHFDIDTRPKILTTEMLNSIATGSIRVYFAGILQYKDANGEQVIPYCGFTDASVHSIPNCAGHNAPFHKP